MINVWLLVIAFLILLTMSTRREMFGYAGYSDPVSQIVFDESLPDMTRHVETTDVSINNDTIENLVMTTNTYLNEKTGLCTYIIETTSIKKFVHVDGGDDIYRCMFMVLKRGGFAFGFALTIDISMSPSGRTHVLSARTQPIDVMPPTDQTPFQSDIEGHAFVDAALFKESELKLIKNK